jgi:hypothetical protein
LKEVRFVLPCAELLAPEFSRPSWVSEVGCFAG